MDEYRHIGSIALQSIAKLVTTGQVELVTTGQVVEEWDRACSVCDHVVASDSSSVNRASWASDRPASRQVQGSQVV